MVAGNPTSTQIQTGTPNQQSIEVQLTELKRLFDANLISKDVYTERQKAILESQGK